MCLLRYVDIFQRMVLRRVPARTESPGSSASSRSRGPSLDHPPSHRRDGHGGGGGGGVGFLRLQLVDEGLDGGELVRQLAEVGLQGVELFVQVIQSLGQRLDPEKKEETKKRERNGSVTDVTTSECNYPCPVSKPY